MKTSFFTGLICALALAAFPLMAAIPPSGDLKFAVMRSDSDIGRHSVSFERKGDELHVDVAIDLEVSIAFVTVFTYRHRNHEVWKNGRLVSIETTTDDNGDEYSLSGHAVGNGFKVDGAAGSFIAPADIIPTSYWNPATLEQTQLLDTQKGRLMEVEISKAGSERLELSGRSLLADRYRMSGDLRLDLWYGQDGRWAKIAFDARGAEVVYYLQGGEPQAAQNLISD